MAKIMYEDYFDYLNTEIDESIKYFLLGYSARKHNVALIL